MNTLYVIEDKNKVIGQKENKEDNIYVLDMGNNQVYHYTDERLVSLDYKIAQTRVNLGKEFRTSYEAMLIVKELLNYIQVDHVKFYCSYLNAYFIIQYILYSGRVNNKVQIVDKECYRKKIRENIYKLPYYWMQNIEDECVQLFKVKKTGYYGEQLPLLSIIITYYNLGEYICEALESIQKCNYTNYEIIIVNDGSTDEASIETLNKIPRDTRMQIINQENKGLSAARNTGAVMAQGKYITFLDADDTIDINYYTQCIKVLEEHQQVDIVYSWVKFFEGKDEIWPTFNLRLPYLLLSNMAAAFYVVRKEKFMSFGLNKEEMKQGMEDYDSLINMCKNGCKGVSIPEALSNYRYRFNSMSKSFNPNSVIKIYNEIVDAHNEVYQQYSTEVIKLMNTNGPGYLWNNPTLEYPSVALNVNEDVNDVKYLLLRLLNTKVGKVAIKLLKIYKIKKEIR